MTKKILIVSRDCYYTEDGLKNLEKQYAFKKKQERNLLFGLKPGVHIIDNANVFGVKGDGKTLQLPTSRYGKYRLPRKLKKKLKKINNYDNRI